MRTSIIWALGWMGCGGDALFPEGSDERDSPWTAPMDSGSEPKGETGTFDTGMEPLPAEQQVCYPGSDWTYETCFDLVEWSTEWGSDYAYPDPYQGSAQYAAPVRFIDLKAADSNVALAPNFVLSEFMLLYKGRFALTQVHFIETLQMLREESGGAIYVNSGFRSPGYNDSVGGVEHSRHIFGDAVDMYSGVLGLEALGALCEDLGADYVGLYESHVHCDWRQSPLDPAFFDEASNRSAVQSASNTPFQGWLVHTDAGWTAPALGFGEGEPLRVWEALDESGRLLHRTSGRSFVPPDRTAEVRVVVGGQIRLAERLSIR